MERCVGGWIEKGETTPALVKCGTNEEELELGRLNDEVFWGEGEFPAAEGIASEVE
jgi:hypothetical protein